MLPGMGGAEGGQGARGASGEEAPVCAWRHLWTATGTTWRFPTHGEEGNGRAVPTRYEMIINGIGLRESGHQSTPDAGFSPPPSSPLNSVNSVSWGEGGRGEGGRGELYIYIDSVMMTNDAGKHQHIPHSAFRPDHLLGSIITKTGEMQQHD